MHLGTLELDIIDQKEEEEYMENSQKPRTMTSPLSERLINPNHNDNINIERIFIRVKTFEFVQ